MQGVLVYLPQNTWHRRPMIVYRCKICRWITEAEALPRRCSRCSATVSFLQVLDDVTVQQLVDNGTVKFCNSCDVLHTR